MDSVWWAELVFIAVLILLNGFFAAAEIAIISVRRSRLKELAHNGNRNARIILKLLEDPSRLFASIQIGVTFVGFLASAVAAVSTYRVLAGWLDRIPLDFVRQNSQAISITLVTVIISLFTLVLGELTPKNIALRYAEPLSLGVARFMQVLSTAAKPLIWGLAKSSDLLLAALGVRKAAHSEHVTEDEIRSLLRAGHEQGLLDRSETEMIHGLFELGDKTVREVMVPRVDMVAVEEALALPRVARLMERAGHSRVPVYRDTIDNIVGIAYATDVNRFLRRGAKRSAVGDMVREAHFVPESKKLDGLLKEFQAWKTHLAVVVDEYGGTAGMITLEDVLEEIVGDIRDEFDTEEPLYRRLDERSFRIDCRINIDEINEALGTAFPTDGYETFGGFIYDLAGKVPASGDRLRWPAADPQWEFTVETVRRRRIITVRARRLPRPTARNPETPALQ
jgi:putative hemolysin